jgi:4-amino-4-deoxy-L-arabinose transferase-like glycosyltransferase
MTSTTQPEAVWPAGARLRARPSSPARAALAERLPLAALLGLTAVLYLWGLSRSGYANDFYAAAVKAGTQSWKAFFYGSLDSSSFITVDKPPASLWVMELSGRIFGFSSVSMLVPQALEGVASVALLYATVRRWFPRSAALLSGLVLAVTPVAALMFRFNNPDALLVLLLVVAAYGVTRALEHAGTRWLLLAGGAVGFAFLTKMMQGFLVVPAFGLVYLVAAPTPLRRRLWQLVAAGAAIVVAGGWWVAIVELVPASARPYIGGSTNNSVLDLIWGYNGLGRISGTGTGTGAGFSGSPGILRLFNGEMGGQISWLVPAALVALGAGLLATLRAPRTDRIRAALLLWGGWLLLAGGVFSFMSGVIHPYYTNMLAPAVAVLVGVSATLLWRARGYLPARCVLAAMLILTSWWSYRLLERTPSWHPWLRTVVLVAGLVAAVGIVGVGAHLSRPALAALAAAGLLAGLGGPVAYTLDTVMSARTGSLASAGPAVAGGFGGPQGMQSPGGGGTRSGTRPAGGGPGTASTSSALTSLLAQDASGYTWIAATGSSGTAAPIELATGKAVMAIGGFTGSDEGTTLARFERLVAAGEIHYYMPGGNGGGPRGGQGAASEIASWVSAHFKAVTVGGTTVYDLTQKTSS